jgi:ketosteroid isomerase-like protein
MSEENVEIVRRWWKGSNENGLPPLELCDEEIQIRNPPDLPGQALYEGHAGVRRWCDEVFDILDGPRVVPEEIVDVDGDGRTMLMLLRVTGTAKYTGIDVDYEWAAIWTIREGKVLRAQGYLDRADAIEAAGLPK